MPFGNASLTPEYIGFLSMEQALADYAVLVKFVQKDMGAQNCSVFSFGGRYDTQFMV